MTASDNARLFAEIPMNDSQRFRPISLLHRDGKGLLRWGMNRPFKRHSGVHPNWRLRFG